MNLDDHISKCNAELALISNNLKSKFVGIDNIIDAVIKNITAWYIMPELILSPVIINLWGMTGVGKTDLVRTLVKELKMTDRFVEIQLSNKSNTKHHTIQDILDESSIESEETGIILLDEMQRFRTIGDDEKEIADSDFQDIWMLLSDGKFSGKSNSRSSILEMILNNSYYEDYCNSKKEEEQKQKETTYERTYKISFWEARLLKKKLKLKESIEEIMKWDEDKKNEIISTAFAQQCTFEGDKFEKVLIFISGNIDEAYEMSGYTSDTDIDADTLHDFSLNINVVSIKNALKKRFKPEQISRLGNNHIIYPSLSKKSYQDIIKQRIKKVADTTKYLGIELYFDQTVYDTIYRNGVFPAQGVRPVISTISSIISTSLPGFVLSAVQTKQNDIHIRCDNEYIIAKIGNQEFKNKFNADIDKIKKDKTNNIDSSILTAVHESGHAVVYSILFKVPPTQAISTTSSDTTQGFVGIHKMDGSKNYIRKRICVLLAGFAAEEFVFGDEYKTSGAVYDIEHATMYASAFFRSYGMDGYISKIINPFGQATSANLQLGEIDAKIEQFMKDECSHASQILTENKDFFKKVSDVLFNNGNVSPEKIQEIAQSCGIILTTRSSKETLFNNFHEKYKLCFNEK